MPVCLNCRNQFDISNRSCCSIRCARVYSSTLSHNPVSWEKRRASWAITYAGPEHKNKWVDGKRCARSGCDVVFSGKAKTRFCSKSCASKSRKATKQTAAMRAHLRSVQLKYVEEGKHKAWKPRSAPSYPEVFTASVLRNCGVVFESEYFVSRYYADFAFLDKKIDLEIDGRQHSYRKESDTRRDAFFKSIGWIVVRIPWSSTVAVAIKLKEFLTEYGIEAVHTHGVRDQAGAVPATPTIYASL